MQASPRTPSRRRPWTAWGVMGVEDRRRIINEQKAGVSQGPSEDDGSAVSGSVFHTSALEADCRGSGSGSITFSL
ncbi:unnamed protein product [Gadus morhua 'NCC']